MKYRTGILLAFVFFCCVITGGAISAEEYKLGPGDVLNISVWGFEELSTGNGVKLDSGVYGFIVRPDGKVSFPLIGEVPVAGLSVSEVTRVFTEQLKDYYNDPKVTVNIAKFRTTRVYVLGEVNRPGMYELEKTHNVLDALGAAGGYNQYAAKKSVFIIRNGKTEQPVKINLLQLLKQGDMRQNYTLAEGDVVFLTSNNKINFAQDIFPVISGAYFINQINND